MNPFPDIDRWVLPEAVLRHSLAEMALDGAHGNEGVALWLGRRAAGQAEISHVVILRGADVVRQPGFLQIGSASINDVADLAIERGVSLIGQIHAHGHGYGVDLSPTDRRYGINVPGYLSLVAPHYGTKPHTTLLECGCHVYEARFGYRRMQLSEVAKRIELVAGGDVPILIAGGNG